MNKEHDTTTPLDEYRKLAYQMMGVGPEYKGDVLLPTHMFKTAGQENDKWFLQRLGEHHLHLLNRRKNHAQRKQSMEN